MIMGIVDAILSALFVMLIVFVVLIVLWLLIKLFSSLIRVLETSNDNKLKTNSDSKL